MGNSETHPLVLEQIRSQKWFHAIKFDDEFTSKGRFELNRPQNYTLFGVLSLLEQINIENKSCLDIGTMDGLVAFTLKQKGAARVVATDLAYRQTFEFGKNRLGLNIEYVYPVRVSELPKLIGENLVDLIVCAGVLYHLFEPLTALIICREQLKENGFLILETQYLHDESRSLISFSPSNTKRGNPHANTFFIPSYSAIFGMLEVAGFSVVTTIATNGRITILARAVKPSQLRGSTEVIRKVHKTYVNYKNYAEMINYKKLEDCTLSSSIKYSNAYLGDYFQYSSLYRTENKLNVPWLASMSQKFVRLFIDLKFKIKTSIARRKWLHNA